jgi:hypothetical protein
VGNLEVVCESPQMTDIENRKIGISKKKDLFLMAFECFIIR